MIFPGGKIFGQLKWTGLTSGWNLSFFCWSILCSSELYLFWI